MSSIKVNADYESVLFTGKSQAIINEALEFLAFYISDKAVFTHKKYTPEYLEHIYNVTKKFPQLTHQGHFENWWGDLKNPELERKLNSKLTSTELSMTSAWDEGIILNSRDDLSHIKWNKTYVLKNPFDMSGRGLRKVKTSSEVEKANFPMILEPFHERIFDFSHYVYPEGDLIAYQNLVDERFQYRATIFANYQKPILKELSIYPEITSKDWERFGEALKAIITYYKKIAEGRAFSIDSYVYKNHDQLCLRFMSEVNVRRTMGSIAYEISQSFGNKRPWAMMVLGTLQKKLSFSQIKKSLGEIELKRDSEGGVLLLSPDDVRFQIFFLSAQSNESGKNLFQRLKELLPDCQFSIKI